MNAALEPEVMQPEHTTAIATRESSTMGHALPLDEIKQRLHFIRQVMADTMEEGQDYGLVPGCGNRPSLFQPGAQKLALTFQLRPQVQQEVITDYPSYHRGYRLIVRVGGLNGSDGVGECSTMESKYRYRQGDRICPNCKKTTIIKGKAEYGGGWVCFSKKGGCGSKWEDGAKEIEGQNVGKVEHDSPADFWNTCRKMAFKRAFVHAIINATNTSELWSQDLEDLAANGVIGAEPVEAPPQRPEKKQPPKPKAESSAIPIDQQEKAAVLELLNTAARAVLLDFDAIEAYLRQHKIGGEILLGPKGRLQDLPTPRLKWFAEPTNWQIFASNVSLWWEQQADSQIPGAEVQAPMDSEDATAAAACNAKIAEEAMAKALDTRATEAGVEFLDGILEVASAKPGTTKSGKPFTKYNFKIDGQWLSTFDANLYEAVKGMKGPVRYGRKQGKFGFDLTAIEPA